MRLLLALFVLYFIVLIATLAYALGKGGREERTGVIVIVLGVLLSEASRLNPGKTDVMVIDVAMFIAFAAIAYRSNKFWPIWAAASQLVAVLTHWVVVLNPSVVRTVYATAQPFWAFPVIAALAIGTRSHQKSLR